MRSVRTSARCSTSCRHACACCAFAVPSTAAARCGTIHQAPAPERPIAKGMASPGLLGACAGQQILRPHAALSSVPDLRPTWRRDRPLDLANWVGGACWWPTSGAVGGSFGLAALAIELPISTIIMLRSIGDVARSEGEDLTSSETALACLQVFALGGLKGEADAAECGIGFTAKTKISCSASRAGLRQADCICCCSRRH